MIFLLLLCLVRVESSVVDSRGVDEVTKWNVRRIHESLPTAETESTFDLRFHAESIPRRLARSVEPDRDDIKSKWVQLSPLHRFAQNLLDSAWVRPPISKYLTTVVIPGMVLNHGKISDLGQLRLISVTHERRDGQYHTNITVFHGKQFCYAFKIKFCGMYSTFGRAYFVIRMNNDGYPREYTLLPMRVNEFANL